MATIVTDSTKDTLAAPHTMDKDVKPQGQQLPIAQAPAESGQQMPEHMSLIPLDEDLSKDLVQLFKLLSDETRLQILNYLYQKRELNVRSLCELLKQTQPSVSHHLALLRVAGLIAMRREGKHNYYRIVQKRMSEVSELVASAIPEKADWENEESQA